MRCGSYEGDGVVGMRGWCMRCGRNEVSKV